MASPVTAGISKPLDRKDEIAGGDTRRWPHAPPSRTRKEKTEIATRTGPRVFFFCFFFFFFFLFFFFFI